MVKDRVVYITGAASGIGYQMGVEFLKQGAKVVFTDINEQKLNEITKDLSDLGYECTGLKVDVTNEEELKQSIQQTVRIYGSLDVLINNAGLQHVSPIEDFPTEKYEFMIKIMLTAPFVAIKHVLPIMKEQGHGRILNMASINGLVGFAGKAAYNSAKHGLIGLTKVAALEVADTGITVNAICPGYVDTPLVRGQFEDLAKTRNVPVERVKEEVLFPLVPQKRLLDVKEIADYALYLASDKAKGITGQALALDGGYTVQ
ncbi:oxidoreductase [Oceanobacillus iheyensis HTE831]|uniref:Oxidoreductase n=1 Tax=Oceanobacillus iheyensis (strain DSM 14371 / CIP 107618 / JCM 11309 / KCTC 3954 / HTE831) TaxID=221109 RepID=Q8EN56_OCEIH|nr:3-hydroxybutyrate dehydrogenase [Oceanobacillus iheyensis]BAC14587.1 oxidoreductase [Oceanobacillus iheyensis HTE831]